MKQDNIWVSFCVPTNGILEWVLPVLDSILEQNAPREHYEIVVTDNGDNTAFAQAMEGYLEKYDNILYQKTQAEGFLNQMEAFKLARGKLIKFVNHRMHLLPEAVNHFIAFSQKEWERMPQVYFSNGVLGKNTILEMDSYDAFIKDLSIYSSWSAGIALWKKDLEWLLKEKTEVDDLFPHIAFLLPQEDKREYIINDIPMLGERETDATKKGRYNLFFAFAVKYPTILLKLVAEGKLRMETFLTIKVRLGAFLGELYYLYILRKKPCSYQLDGYDKYLCAFFGKREILLRAFQYGARGVVKRLFRR